MSIFSRLEALEQKAGTGLPAWVKESNRRWQAFREYEAKKKAEYEALSTAEKIEYKLKQLDEMDYDYDHSNGHWCAGLYNQSRKYVVTDIRRLRGEDLETVSAFFNDYRDRYPPGDYPPTQEAQIEHAERIRRRDNQYLGHTTRIPDWERVTPKTAFEEPFWPPKTRHLLRDDDPTVQSAQELRRRLGQRRTESILDDEVPVVPVSRGAEGEVNGKPVDNDLEGYADPRSYTPPTPSVPMKRQEDDDSGIFFEVDP